VVLVTHSVFTVPIVPVLPPPPDVERTEMPAAALTPDLLAVICALPGALPVT
jgi:hypothetical protein